jgi:colicin import membrane protein
VAPRPAPRAEAPTPDADIAVERKRERKLQAERKRVEEAAEAERLRVAAADRKRAEEARLKAEEDRKKRELEEQREAKAEEDRLALQRQANLRRMMGQAGAAASAPAGSGNASQTAAPTAAYAGRLIARVRPNIVYTGSAPPSATAEVEVVAAAGGTVISRRLVKGSGYKEWDEAVLRAIDRTPALPRDTDGRVPERLTIAFKRD